MAVGSQLGLRVPMVTINGAGGLREELKEARFSAIGPRLSYSAGLGGLACVAFTGVTAQLFAIHARLRVVLGN